MMKAILRKIFAPLLNPLERGDEPFSHKPMNRKILLVVSGLFAVMCASIIFLMPADADKGYFIPALVFALVALVGLIVGVLGNDRAVAKIWGNH